MRKIVLRNGLLAALVLFIAGFLNFKITGDDYAKQEIGGYIGMIIAMIFVFLGIKQYRDQVNGGVISFAQALWAGTLIVIFPAIAFGLFDIVYIKCLDPNFLEKFYNWQMQQMKAQLPAADYQQKAQQLEQQKAMFMNLGFQFALMTATVLVIGIAAAAGSAFILQKKPKTT